MNVPLDVVIYLQELIRYDRARLDELSARLEASKPKEK